MTINEAIEELREASGNELVRYRNTEHHYDEVMKRIEAFGFAIGALKVLRSLRGNGEEDVVFTLHDLRKCFEEGKNDSRKGD